MSPPDPSDATRPGLDPGASPLLCLGRSRQSWLRRWRWLARAYWDLHSRHWDDSTPDGRSRHAHVLRWLDRPELGAGTRVLDVGCGTGTRSLPLAKRGFTVVGLDFSPGMLTRARAKVEPGLRGIAQYLQVDFNDDLPFPDGSFDAALALAVLHAVDDVPRFLREVRRVLRPRGLFLLGVLRFREASRASDCSWGLRTRLLWRLGRVWPGWRERMGRATRDDLLGLLASAQFEIVGQESHPTMLSLLTRARPPEPVADGPILGRADGVSPR